MIKKLTEDQILDIINLYKSGKSPKEIGIKYNIYNNSVTRILRKRGINRNQLIRITEEQKDIIKKRYLDGDSSEKIAKNLNINGTTVCRILKNNNIKIRDNIENKRKYKIDFNWLDKIDSEEKAYFLGLMWSDGNVSKKNSDCSIRLHIKDIDILQKLSHIIFGFDNIKIENNKKTASLRISSKVWKYNLIKLGCAPNKTFIVNYPLWLDDNLHRHFIRGLVDGDGCIKLYKDKVVFDYTGTEQLLNGILDIFNKTLNIKKAKLYERHKQRNTNIRSFRYSSLSTVKKICDWLYLDATIYLNRKKHEYDKIVKLYNQK